MATVTKESINEMLANPNPAYVQTVIGRALVVLFRNQTADEQQANVTNKDNGIGFTGADADSGCKTAKYYLKHKRLEDWQVARWLRPNRLAKYHKQLNAAAESK